MMGSLTPLRSCPANGAAPALPMVRLRFTARTGARLQLPPYAGSMLRGALGHALLALMPLPHRAGQPCTRHGHCAYCQVFSVVPTRTHRLQKFSRLPSPYVIEPPAGQHQLRSGQPFAFSMILLGRALAHRHIIVQAWQHALQRGLGPHHVPCTLLGVQQQPGPPANAPALHQQATLNFHTPLRLQCNGRPVGKRQIDARRLLMALARRWQLLQDVHLGAEAPQQDFAALVAAAEGIAMDATSLRWMDWGRYSQRQKREMKLGGLVGTLHLHGPLQPFAQLLHLGQWLHVGKNTSFGLGGYHLIAQTVHTPTPEPAQTRHAGHAQAARRRTVRSPRQHRDTP